MPEVCGHSARGLRDTATLGPTSGSLLSKSVSNEKENHAGSFAGVLKTKHWPVNMAHPETIPHPEPRCLLHASQKLRSGRWGLRRPRTRRAVAPARGSAHAAARGEDARATRRTVLIDGCGCVSSSNRGAWAPRGLLYSRGHRAAGRGSDALRPRGEARHRPRGPVKTVFRFSEGAVLINATG
jgi:hypothetical protein